MKSLDAPGRATLHLRLNMKEIIRSALSPIPFGPVLPTLLRSARFLERAKPWITSPACEWLESHVTPVDVVLEFGGGASTLWWAKLARKVVTVEASHEWCALLLDRMRRRPDLLKKWRLVMSPCDWNPDISEPKPYWFRHREHLLPEERADIESDYLSLASCSPTVCFIDGSIRPKTIDHVAINAAESGIRMIVVDNTEAEYIAEAVAAIPGVFCRHDFPADRRDRIPEHQEGWITSVWTRP